MRRCPTVAISAAMPLLLLAACNIERSDREDQDNAAAVAETEPDNLADSMASRDDGSVDPTLDIPDAQERPVMQLQVVLERQGFGPGVIDGKMGLSTRNALEGFQEANGLEVTGEHDEATKKNLERWSDIGATRVVRIPEEWARLTFKEIPEDPAKQAEMEKLGYESLDEKLAERFHTTVEVLKALNPGGEPARLVKNGTQATLAENEDASEESDEGAKRSSFAAGQLVRVPNIGADRIAPGSTSNPEWEQTLTALGVGSDQPKASRIVVDKSEGTLRAYDSQDKLIALYTVTTGSSQDPLPLGEWGINGVGHNPPFSYNPELFWDVPDENEKHMLPPGPNGPVGVVWIDLTKEHYGIHGTPEPQTIGRAQSHGCVRLTNWDAARLAQMVSGSTQVTFKA